MMLIRPGVDICGIRPELVLGLMVAASLWPAGIPMVVTSVRDGTHMVNSLHYQGLAADLRTAGGIDAERAEQLRKTLALWLGAQWDVVLEADHLHIEFDPKFSGETCQAKAAA